jgi:hypothetical protein
MKLSIKNITRNMSILGLLLGATSCEKYLDDAFINPNAPTVVSPELALPPIAANMARGIQFDARIAGSFVQYFTRTGAGDSFDRHGYLPNSDTGGELWRMHYYALGQNLNNMIRDAKAQGKEEYVGVAFSVFAWSWLNLTDYHNEVILNQAFDTSRLTFDYDSQEDTYKQVAAMCDSANRYLDIAAKKTISAGFAEADAYLYGGDLTKWKKFVSGVRAKLLHRYSLKSTYKPDEVIKAVDAAFTSVDDEAMVKFKNSAATADEANFFGARRNNMGTYRQSEYFVKLLDGSILTEKDPRLAYLLKPSDDKVFRGIAPNAGEATTLPNNRKTYNFFGTIATIAPVVAFDQDVNSRSYFKNNAPFPIMTLAELQFIKAEAAFIKGDKATALDAYKKGIKANFDMFKKYFTGYENFTDKQVTDYINSTKISPVAADLKLNQIMVQKFIALWGHGFMETWVDMRRYKYSPDIYSGFALPNALYPDNAGKLVQRVRPRYNSEYLWNVEALRKIGGLNPDYHTIECWFSKP